MALSTKLSEHKSHDDHEHHMMHRPSKYSDVYIQTTSNRMIFLAEPITKEVASAFTALIMHYNKVSKQHPVTIYLNSPGGDSSALLQMYSTMKASKAPIVTICIGAAYSAAAVLLAAGDKRLAFKNSSIMIHGIQAVFPPITDIDQGSSSNYFRFLDSHNDDILKILSKHTKKPFAQIKQDCKNDLFFTAKQALAYGMIDAII